MTQMIVDPTMQARLSQVEQTLEIRDESGRLLGHFVPALDQSVNPAMQPQVSSHELDRREQQGGGRSLAEILADLEARP